MWTPDLELRPSPGLTLVIGLTHGAAVLAALQLDGLALWLLPVILFNGAYSGLRDGWKCLPMSIQRVWLTEKGWCWQFRNGRRQGPFPLHSQARVDSRFVRLSFKGPGYFPRHVLVTAGMTDPDRFRRLQVFLRWAADRNQVLGR